MSKKEIERVCVLHDWVVELPFKEQTGLISAIRGYDESSNLNGIVSDVLKNITRMIRFLVLKNADKSTKFMSDEIVSIDILKECIDIILANSDRHFIDHMIKAIKIISIKHPNNYVRLYHKNFYDEIKNHIEEYDEKVENEADEFFEKAVGVPLIEPVDSEIASAEDTIEIPRKTKTKDVPMKGHIIDSVDECKTNESTMPAYTTSIEIDSYMENLDSNYIETKCGLYTDILKRLDEYKQTTNMGFSHLKLGIIEYEGVRPIKFYSDWKKARFVETHDDVSSSSKYRLVIYSNIPTTKPMFIWVSIEKLYTNTRFICDSIINHSASVDYPIELVKQITEMSYYFVNGDKDEVTAKVKA